MEQSKNIIDIDINRIHPHPWNPRKDLGDLTELIASIRVFGIMQNLTVIPIVGNPGEYMTVIGHRRTAAAKEAGLKTLPCTIREDMTEKEQLAIMMEENMQRNDLTIYEQAQGFQMMLDLGETEESIAQKTGFSRTTIRHRLQIAKLDKSILKKRQQQEDFQLNLKHLYELEKIKNVDTRNKVLQEARSSSELTWRVSTAVKQEEKEEKLAVIIPKLEEMGIKKAPAVYERERYSGKWQDIESFELGKDPGKDLAQEKDLYYFEEFSRIKIVKRKKQEEKTKNNEGEKKRSQIVDIEKRIREKRRQTILMIIEGELEKPKDINDIRERLWALILDASVYTSYMRMREFYTGKNDFQIKEEDREAVNLWIESVENQEEQMMIMVQQGLTRSVVDYLGKYDESEAERNIRFHEILGEYGFALEPEEQGIMDGTSELFEK